MRAMIFAAGLGTRLKPYTLHHPKALVPVGSVPMLERVIMRLKHAGISEMVVNVHHFADQIIDFLAASNNFGCTVHISDETGLLLDTGGGILAARRWLDKGDEPFVVHNADILTDISLTDMVACNRGSSAVATLLVAQRDTSRYLLFDPDMRMRGWTNVKTGEVRPPHLIAAGLDRLAFGGVHVMRPAIFGPLASFRPAGVPFSIMDFYVEACAGLPICGFTAPEGSIWLDVGKPEALARAEQLFC